MHMDQGQKLSNSRDHCHPGINIAPTATSLCTFRKMLPQGWNPKNRTPSPVSIAERKDTTLSSQPKGYLPHCCVCLRAIPRKVLRMSSSLDPNAATTHTHFSLVEFRRQRDTGRGKRGTFYPWFICKRMSNQYYKQPLVTSYSRGVEWVNSAKYKSVWEHLRQVIVSWPLVSWSSLGTFIVILCQNWIQVSNNNSAFILW